MKSVRFLIHSTLVWGTGEANDSANAGKVWKARIEITSRCFIYSHSVPSEPLQETFGLSQDFAPLGSLSTHPTDRPPNLSRATENLEIQPPQH